MSLIPGVGGGEELHYHSDSPPSNVRNNEPSPEADRNKVSILTLIKLVSEKILWRLGVYLSYHTP